MPDARLTDDHKRLLRAAAAYALRTTRCPPWVAAGRLWQAAQCCNDAKVADELRAMADELHAGLDFATGRRDVSKVGTWPMETKCVATTDDDSGAVQIV